MQEHSGGLGRTHSLKRLPISYLPLFKVYPMVGVGELRKQLLRGCRFPARLMKTAEVTQRCGCMRIVELFTLKWLISYYLNIS